MKKVALLCAYRLLPDRIGGMDYFFWQFDEACRGIGVEPVWFFPNKESHGSYNNLQIVAEEGKSVEQCFLDYNQTFDILFTHFVELCTPFFKKARPLVIEKVIAVDHNPRPFLGYPWKKKWEKKLKGFLYGKYIDSFIGVSEYTVTELINDFGSGIANRTSCIYNGILTDAIRIRQERNILKPRFVVVSHLRESKGIQDLIKAVSLLDEELKQEMQITVFGSGPYEQVLLDLCENLKVRSNFDFRGNSSSIKNELANFDYLLQPTHMECFSLSILESLAANVPVITTPVGGNQEAVKHHINGYILPVANPQIWASKLAMLWHGEIAIAGDISKPIRQQFNLEAMVKNYLKFVAPF